MKIEHTIKRDNGDKIVIRIETTNSSQTHTPLFARSCSFGENVFGWEWRKWDFDERKEKTKDYILQFVTIDEIREVRDELLNAMHIDSYRF